MVSSASLTAQLRNLVYGICSDEEEAALQARITSEADVARVYSAVRLQADLFFASTKLKEEPIALVSPEEKQATEAANKGSAKPTRPVVITVPPLLAADSSDVPTESPFAAGGSAAHSVEIARLAPARTSGPAWGLFANVGILALAIGMLFLVIGPSTEQSSPDGLRGLDHAHLWQNPRLIVLLPAELTPGVQPVVSVLAQSLTGEPRAGLKLTCQFAGEKSEIAGLIGESNEQTAQTDTDGYAHFVLPALQGKSANPTVTITAEGEPKAQMSATIRVADPRPLTYISSDRRQYAPGETVQLRAVTLVPPLFESGSRARTEFTIRGPLYAGGKTFAPKRLDSTSTDIALAEWEIPSDAPAGTYLLESRVGDAAPGCASFRVVPEEKKPGWLRGWFFSDAKPTAADGSASRSPKESPLEEASPEKPGAGTGKARIDFFFPEGRVVEGLTSRVYFLVRDERGRPLAVKAKLKTPQGDTVADLVSGEDGLGQFELKGTSGSFGYRVHGLPGYGDQSLPAAFPPSVNRGFAILPSRDGFEAGKPIELSIGCNGELPPLLLTVESQDAAVWQQVILPGAKEPNELREFPVSIPLPDRVSGALRISLLDARLDQKSQVLAQCLVYRQPAKFLRVELADSTMQLHPGKKTQVKFKVTDEQGHPVAANLAVSAVWVPESLHSQIRRAPGIEERMLLGSGIVSPCEETTRLGLSSINFIGSPAGLLAIHGRPQSPALPQLFDNAAGAYERYVSEYTDANRRIASGQRNHAYLAFACAGVVFVLVSGMAFFGLKRGWLAWIPALGLALFFVLNGMAAMQSQAGTPALATAPQPLKTTLVPPKNLDGVGEAGKIPLSPDPADSDEAKQRKLNQESKPVTPATENEFSKPTVDEANHVRGSEEKANEAKASQGQTDELQPSETKPAKTEPAKTKPAGAKPADVKAREAAKPKSTEARREEDAARSPKIVDPANEEEAAAEGGKRLPLANAEPPEQFDNSIHWSPTLHTDDDGLVAISLEIPKRIPPKAVIQFRVDAHAAGRLGSDRGRLQLRTAGSKE